MSTSPTHSADGGGNSRWIGPALLAVLLATLPFTVSSAHAPVHDASLYVLTSRAILAGEGYSYLGEPFVIRPPGFPVALAPLLAFWDGRWVVLNALVSLTGIGCVLAMFTFYRARLGAWIAAALAISVWVNPLFQELSTQIMSDVPGAALLFVALLLNRRAERQPSLARNAWLGLAICAGLYVRSINLVLIVAVALSRLARCVGADDRRRALRSLKLVWPAVLIPIVAWLPWSQRDAAQEIKSPPEQVYLHSYSTAMWHEHPSLADSPELSLAQIAGRVPDQLAQMMPILGGGLTARDDWRVLHTGLAIVGLVGATLVLVRRRSVAEFAAGGAFLVVAIYFSFKPRLVLPAWLLLWPATWDALHGLLLRVRVAPRVATPALAGAILATSLPFFRPGAQHEAWSSAQSAREEVLAHIERTLPPMTALAAPVGWHLGVHTERDVYSLQFVLAHRGPQGVLELIRRHGIGAVLVDPNDVTGAQWLALLERAFGPGETVGEWRVFLTGR